jgi:hypothetical protein
MEDNNNNQNLNNNFDPNQQPVAQPVSFEQPNFDQVVPNDDYNFPQAAVQPTTDPNQFYGDFSQQFPDQSQQLQPEAQFAQNQSAYQPTEIPAEVAPLQSTVTQNPYGTYPDELLNASTQPKFEEKKSGNKLFFILAGVIIVIMIGILGFLFYNNYRSTQDAQNNSNNTQQNTTPTTQTPTTPATVTFNNATTGGVGTPATLSRKFNLAEPPAEWVKSRFTNLNRDENGKCTNDKVCGSQADPDDDNLTNVDEYNFQTDPLVNDSDKDGLADGDETYIYFSDPVKSDSDNDSYKDGSELANCFDPISSSGSTIDKDRLAKISSAVGLKKIKEPTISSLKAVGATTGDLDKGYVEAKCVTTPAPATPAPETTNSTTTNPATTNTTSTSSTATQI